MSHGGNDSQRTEAEQSLELSCRNDTGACSLLLPFIKYVSKNVVTIRFSCVKCLLMKAMKALVCPTESCDTKALT